jgi:LPXTG-motif cell wall-anchored protein
MAIRQVTRAGVGLAIGIIILVVLVFAGLWFVRERGEQARREEAINIANQQLQAESDQEVAIDTNESNSEQSKPAATNGSAATSNGSDSSSEAAQPATELPQTGTADGVLALSAGLVTFAALSLYRSRQVLQKVR